MSFVFTPLYIYIYINLHALALFRMEGYKQSQNYADEINCIQNFKQKILRLAVLKSGYTLFDY